MTCPHAETTAILALFGEAPPPFDDHLLTCADCQEVLADHHETLALITPHLPAVAAAAAPSARRQRWPRRLLISSSVAAAAAAAAAVLLWGSAAPTTPPPSPAREVLALGALETRLGDDGDRLLALEMDLALLVLEEGE